LKTKKAEKAQKTKKLLKTVFNLSTDIVFSFFGGGDSPSSMRLWGKILARAPNAQMKIKGMKGCMRGSKSDAARE
jgi:hypothetical protein